MKKEEMMRGRIGISKIICEIKKLMDNIVLSNIYDKIIFQIFSIFFIKVLCSQRESVPKNIL